MHSDRWYLPNASCVQRQFRSNAVDHSGHKNLFSYELTSRLIMVLQFHWRWYAIVLCVCMYKRHFSWRINCAPRYTSIAILPMPLEESSENWLDKNPVDARNTDKAKFILNSMILSTHGPYWRYIGKLYTTIINETVIWVIEVSFFSNYKRHWS